MAKGDLIIIACYVLAEDEEAMKWTPKCVFVDNKNKIRKYLKKLSTIDLLLVLREY